jgi:hypothetical protein
MKDDAMSSTCGRHGGGEKWPERSEKWGDGCRMKDDIIWILL